MQEQHRLLLIGVLLLGGSGGCDGQVAGSPDLAEMGGNRPEVMKVESVDPDKVSTAGGETLRITGRGFERGVEVRIGEALLKQGEVSLRSSTELRVIAPPRPGMPGDVKITVRIPEQPEDGKMVRYYPGVLNFNGNADMPAGSGPIGMHVANLDGGPYDHVIAAYTSRGVKITGSALVVLKGGPDGLSVVSETAIGTPLPQSLAVGDITGDGFPDAVVANPQLDSVSVLYGQADRTFLPGKEQPVGARPVSIALGDVSGDKVDDIIAVNSDSGTLSLLTWQKDGKFSARTVRLTMVTPWAVAAGDLDGDGLTDLAITSHRQGEVNVLLGQPDGNFKDTRADYPTGANPTQVFLRDVDRSGKLDILTVNRGGNNVSVYLNDGKGGFNPVGSPYVGTTPAGLSVTDLNDDGRMDLVVPSYDMKAVAVLAGTGDGRFQPAKFFPAGGYLYAAAAGRFSGLDPLADVITGNSNATISLLANASY